MEREIFELHKKQRLSYTYFKNQTHNRQVDVCYDMMDDDMKENNKRIRIIWEI